MKTCYGCKKLKNFSEYGKWKYGKDGLKEYCKECLSFKRKTHYLKNKDKTLKTCKEYYEKNKSKHNSFMQQHYKRNKSLYVAKDAKRRAALLSRTPKWADLEKIKAYYDVCAFFNEVNGYVKYHVDHILPLQGKNVSGLHVETNLQVIPARENIAKGNKYGCSL